MIITVMEGMFKDGYIYLICRRSEAFEKAWGNDGIRIPRPMLFGAMAELSDWCNNELGEECLFETE